MQSMWRNRGRGATGGRPRLPLLARCHRLGARAVVLRADDGHSHACAQQYGQTRRRCVSHTLGVVVTLDALCAQALRDNSCGARDVTRARGAHRDLRRRARPNLSRSRAARCLLRRFVLSTTLSDIDAQRLIGIDISTTGGSCTPNARSANDSLHVASQSRRKETEWIYS